MQLLFNKAVLLAHLRKSELFGSYYSTHGNLLGREGVGEGERLAMEVDIDTTI